MARTKSVYQLAAEKELAKEAAKLYKRGKSLREVEAILKSRGFNKSYEWIRRALVGMGLALSTRS